MIGFACQGNEFSHYMLLASYFILNRYVPLSLLSHHGGIWINFNVTNTSSERINQHTIYPYVHSLSNLPTSAALLRPVTIPDVLPSDLPEGSDFSLVAGIWCFRNVTILQILVLFLREGDFEEIYGAEEKEDSDHEPQAGKWDAVLTCFFIDTVIKFIL